MTHPLEEGLRIGLSRLDLPLDEPQIQALLSYQDWIAKWNRVYNLTAVREPQEMLTHHLLDSLS
ncbi:RsmG family class I SAM-dependent methyltransferase, partial [Arthrospira platensis SPKY1]|nr:RsmG family class I SAM-dependent methyltransferase [Arthrospira platensis SPKY1]